MAFSYLKTASGKAFGCFLIVLLMTICLSSFARPVFAHADVLPNDMGHGILMRGAQLGKNDDPSHSVFKFNMSIDGREYTRGSAFLVNDDTIVTAYRCVIPSDTELASYGLSARDVHDRGSYTVTVAGDHQVAVKLEKYSESQDMAFLKVDQQLSDGKPLSICDSSRVGASELVHAVGYSSATDKPAFVSGTVSKPEHKVNGAGSFITTTCSFESGLLGGPVVDDAGNVIGVCVPYGDNDKYAAASASDVLVQGLEMDAFALDTLLESSPEPSPVSSDSSPTGQQPETLLVLVITVSCLAVFSVLLIIVITRRLKQRDATVESKQDKLD